MKSFKKYLKEDWWDDLGPEGQEAYINEHPNSKKAKEARAEKDNPLDKRANKPQHIKEPLNVVNNVKPKKDGKRVNISDTDLSDLKKIANFANDKNASSEDLRKIISYSEKMIKDGKNSFDYDLILQDAIANPNISKDLMDEIVDGNNNRSKMALVRNPKLTSEHMNKLAKNGNGWVRSMLAERKDLPRETMDTLIKAPGAGYEMASNSSLPEDMMKSALDYANELKEKGEHNLSDSILLGLVDNKNISAEMVKKIYDNEDMWTEVKVDAEKKLKKLNKIKNKVDPEVKKYAKYYGVNPENLTPEALPILNTPEEYTRTDMVDALVNAGVDYDTAENIAANK